MGYKLLPLIVDWAINEDVNIDWLLKDSKNENNGTEDINRLIVAYKSAEQPIKNAALTMLENSAKRQSP